ncbi:Gldg family protein [Flavitalea sp. BT771]|uniref:Gldg family protein n=1 Tax=Flavitalea sp. BT771 TaxID=3063329 RepID=UPI0026E1686F|nr:Gldg family protein [Flavitalea sp. BT771]MDO6431681.1 Gldg family protein [Flavitalea sp. BT771]MDV6220589.1 Gldg family protein [Flavitalea sp. BT771]
MKTIFRVASTELKTLFYSPIAWFLIIIFFIQAGIPYLSNLESLARDQDSGLKLNISFMETIFYGNRGVFGSVMQNLYLYLPLLTMGLISRETSSGTIRLLYSSPISVRDIVLGKFLSMMVMCLLLTAVVGVFIVSGYFTVQSPDMGQLLSGLLGLYLLLCAYAAIGLFMSSLTNYQVVAAVCTFVIVWVLEYVGGLWQGVAFVRSLTYFLSISGRTGKMLGGLITSKDVIYFILIIYLFLALAVYKLRAGMESTPVAVKVGRYALLVSFVLMVGYVSSIPQLVVYSDVTRNQKNTITPAGQRIIAELGDEPLEVTGYANMLGQYFELGSPDAYNSNLAKWEPYMRFKHNIVLKNMMYYDTIGGANNMMRWYPGKSLEQVAKQVSDSRDLGLSELKKPAEIRKIIDLSDEPGWYTMQLKYKGRKTFLRVFPDNERWPTETEVSAAFKRLLQTKMPKIIFVTGQLERSIDKMGDREYRMVANLKSFRYSLLNQGFDVDTVSLETGVIPPGIAALVLADPRTVLSPAATGKLQQYIDQGGNLLIAGEPGKQSIINPLIRQFGVQLMDGTIVYRSKDLQPELAIPHAAEGAPELYPGLQHSYHEEAVVSMPTATALAYTDAGRFTVKPLLVTDSSISWLKKGKLVTDSAAIEYMAEEGDVRKDLPTAVSLTRQINGRQQRIVIAGDADFMANIEQQRFNMRTINFEFNTGVFSWLSYGEFPVFSSRPAPIDTRVLVTKGQVKVHRIFYLWVLPGIMLVFGVILLLRRKRK